MVSETEFGAVMRRIRKHLAAAPVAPPQGCPNVGLTGLYFQIGREVEQVRKRSAWTGPMMDRLAKSVRDDSPRMGKVADHSLYLAAKFYRDHRELEDEALKEMLAVPWGHAIELMRHVPVMSERLWYARQTVWHGLSLRSLKQMVNRGDVGRVGRMVNNFESRLGKERGDAAVKCFKDPYEFSLPGVGERYRESDVEGAMQDNLVQVFEELGPGFAFVGRQSGLWVGTAEYYLDLLFYHLRLRCYVVVDLKRGVFLPEHAGKISFYCDLVDERMRQKGDEETIGVLLCEKVNRDVASYVLKGVGRAVGVGEFKLRRPESKDESPKSKDKT